MTPCGPVFQFCGSCTSCSLVCSKFSKVRPWKRIKSERFIEQEIERKRDQADEIISHRSIATRDNVVVASEVQVPERFSPEKHVYTEDEQNSYQIRVSGYEVNTTTRSAQR